MQRWFWRQDLKADEKVKIGGVDRSGVSYLRIVPERVAGRAEIVLSDLDGNWHNIYEQGPMALESIEAIPQAAMGNDWPRTGFFESAVFDEKTETFENFFWIRDDNYIRSATNNDPRYAGFQNVEGILFYMNGLAIMTRAKGFNDAPRNFAAWRYQTSVNSGEDHIEGIGDFDGDGRGDIFITSPWGVGVLRLSGNSLWSVDENPHGSVLGNWVSESGDRFAFVGDFDGEPGEEILVQK